jgi:cytochrome c oxidase subunit 2
MLDHSILNPVSPGGLAITNLFIFTLIASAVIILGIAGTLVYTMIRFRDRGEEGEPPQHFGIPKLEIAWTIGPFILLVVVFGASIKVMGVAAPTGDPPADLTVIGHQWWWELRYADGVVAANEIHIPVGRRMFVQLKSADVIHDLWIPQLGPKMDLVPGQTNDMYLEADKPGIYQGVCTQFCGPGHAWMLVRVIAQSPAAFAAWESAQLKPATAPTTQAAILGADLLTQNTCLNCHAIDLVGHDSGLPDVGPDLTHVGGRQTLAAGRMPNSLANMQSWLENPAGWKPGTLMPQFRLTSQQALDLATYLEGLK